MFNGCSGVMLLVPAAGFYNVVNLEEEQCSSETPLTANTQHLKQEVRTLLRVGGGEARLPLDTQPEEPVSVYRKMGL